MAHRLAAQGVGVAKTQPEDTPMAVAHPSMLSRIWMELIAESRQSGKVCRKFLRGGACLAVLVAGETITATVKRAGVKVGDLELRTFLRHANAPEDAQVLTPPEQSTREVDGVTWYFVTVRWSERAAQA